jgi:hypothetical protein
MNHPLDQFFKEKLRDHSVKPGAGAWSRVEDGRSKKNSTWKTWLKVASVALLLGATSAWWMGRSSEPSVEGVILAQERPTSQPPAVADPSKDTASSAVPKKMERKIEPRQQVQRRQPLATAIPKPPHNNESKSNADDQPAETGSIAVAQLEPVHDELPPVAQKSDKPIVVVFTLELPSALPNDSKKEKKTGLQRVLEIAREARTTESPLSGLRQAKEELLAFDFGREKEKKTNNK